MPLRNRDADSRRPVVRASFDRQEIVPCFDGLRDALDPRLARKL